MFDTLLTLTLYLQLGERFSAVHAGLTLIPWSLGSAVGAGLSGGVLGPRFGRSVLQAGAAIKLAGWAIVLATVSAGPVTSLSLAPGLMVAGLGMGLVIAPLFDIILAGVSDRETGSASGVLNASQQLAGAIGVAVLGTVFFSALKHGGFTHALHAALWVQLGLLAGVLAISPLLPRRAREQAQVGAAVPLSA